MTKPLVTLPCTAQELETALHAVCDHDGLWGDGNWIKVKCISVAPDPKELKGFTL